MNTRSLDWRLERLAEVADKRAVAQVREVLSCLRKEVPAPTFAVTAHGGIRVEWAVGILGRIKICAEWGPGCEPWEQEGLVEVLAGGAGYSGGFLLEQDQAATGLLVLICTLAQFDRDD